MKRRMILPALAIVFALASAFATKLPTPQTGWYNVGGPGVSALSGIITTPANASEENPCVTTNTTACLINGNAAYTSFVGARDVNSVMALKYEE